MRIFADLNCVYICSSGTPLQGRRPYFSDLWQGRFGQDVAQMRICLDRLHVVFLHQTLDAGRPAGGEPHTLPDRVGRSCHGRIPTSRSCYWQVDAWGTTYDIRTQRYLAVNVPSACTTMCEGRFLHVMSWRRSRQRCGRYRTTTCLVEGHLSNPCSLQRTEFRVTPCLQGTCSGIHAPLGALDAILGFPIQTQQSCSRLHL
jgi:hypothetical protein